MNPDAIMRDISDSALGVAVERARETKRKRPLFRDPYAGRLAGERGRRIARETRNRLISAGVVVRTAVFDELILQTVKRNGAACVLKLGAGLDTRPYRLDLPGDLRWVEADLPDLDHKAKLLMGELWGRACFSDVSKAHDIFLTALAWPRHSGAASGHGVKQLQDLVRRAPLGRDAADPGRWL